MSAERAPAFVLLAELGDPALARVAAARLLSEGIEVRLQGEWLGPYPLSVGAMARTRLLVRPADLERARLLMTEIEVEEALGGRPTGHHPSARSVQAAILRTLLAAALLWVLRRAGLS